MNVTAGRSVAEYLRGSDSSIGLLLGQSYGAQTAVIHVARTPEEKYNSNQNDAEIENKTKFDLKNASESWIADHAKHVTRMLPGGVFVLGIFVISDEDVFGNPTLSGKLKIIVKYIYKLLSLHEYSYGNIPTKNERYILHFSPKTQVECMKSIEVTNTSIGFFKHVNFTYNLVPFTWQQLECYYEFDDLYPVIIKNTGVSVKEQFKNILDSAYKAIESSTIFLDGQLRNLTESLEALSAKSKGKGVGKNKQDEILKPMQVSMFANCDATVSDCVEYLESEGTTHFSGVISSKVFVQPKCTVEDAIKSVKQDIMRSLSSRFIMHCDTLIDDILLPEEKICFNEPPRRVMIKLPKDIYLFDYLFPGESPVEALVSVKEMLDVDITESDVIFDVETPADTSEFDALDNVTGTEQNVTVPKRNAKIFYIAALIISVLVLVLSFVIQRFVS